MRRANSLGHRPTFALDDDNHEWLRDKARETGKSMALIVNELIAGARNQEVLVTTKEVMDATFAASMGMLLYDIARKQKENDNA